MKPPILTIDTLSDRRDLWHLLHRLHPLKRVAFLEWACIKASKPRSPCPAPVPEMRTYARDAIRCSRADDRLTNMIYLDLLAIAAQYDLDLANAMIACEEYVRKGSLPPLSPQATRNSAAQAANSPRNATMATVATV